VTGGSAAGQTTVGLVGLGNMGRPMAARLVGAGFQVYGFDISQAACEEAAACGVQVEPSIEALAAQSSVIVLMLPTSDHVDAVTAAIVQTRERSTRLVIDMGSSVPARTRELARRLDEAGIALVDAPVSGGVAGARNGSLAVMIGAADDDLADAEPILRAVGARLVHVGPVGSGHAAKALNNLLSACTMLATTEAVLGAARFGIEPERMLAVLNASSGRSGSTEVKFPRFVLERDFTSGFTAALMDKDVGIADDLLGSLAQDAPLAHLVHSRWHELAGSLDPGADHTQIVEPMEHAAGLTLRAQQRDPAPASRQAP
jgi:3-hydroxyisobutyrate dehydrogenase